MVDLGLQESDSKRVSGYIEFNEGIGNANFYLLTKDNETLKIQYPNLKFQNIALEGIEFLIKCTIDLSQKVYCTITDITDYHEMTLKEIEKELGYKIKIKEG